MILLTRLALLPLCIVCLSAAAAPAPVQKTAAAQTRTQPQDAFILGISTHLMNIDKPSRPALSLAAQAGFTSLKDDAFWSTAEPKPGELRIVPQWRNYLSTAQSLNLSTLAILDYSTWFHDNAKPRTPKVKAGYLNYVDYVTRALGNKVGFYEIWNEWDLEAPGDKQLSADYATLVREAAPLIRRNTREANGTPAKILAGSVTPEGMDKGFADQLIDSGAIDLVDGLSVHPSAHCAKNNGNNPESWAQWLRGYEQHIRQRAGRVVPIYITEMPWPNHRGPCGTTPATQAAYLTRILFLARTVPNIQGLWWYDLINDGPDRVDPEHNFGLLNEDLSPKPAYIALKAVADIVKTYTHDARASTQSAGLYLLYFSKGSQHVAVGWAVGGPQQAEITSQLPMSGNVTYVDIAQPGNGLVEGNSTWQCNSQRCTVGVALNSFPKIITLGPQSAVPKP